MRIFGWTVDAADLAFRYALISPLLDKSVARSERRLYRASILARPHKHPTRGWIRISARTLRRWVREYTIQGPTGLERKERCDRGSRILEAQHLDHAVALLEENPRRDTEFLIRELELAFPELRGRVKRSTLNRHLHARGVSRRAHPEETAQGAPYRAFQAREPNDLWHSDCHHGPPALGPDGKEHPTRIFAWIDDFSRLVCHCEAYLEESLPCLEDCFKKAMMKFGIPRRVYTDQGSIYSGTQFALICSDLRIHKVPTTGYTPWKHGKIERLWGVQEDKVWSEIACLPPLPLDRVNRLVRAWVEAEYHPRVHSQTKEAPLQRWEAHRPQVIYPTPEQIERLFWLWERRTVSSTAIVKLAGNQYHVDPVLAERKVIVRYDPFQLERVQIWSNEKRPSLLCEATGAAPLVRRSLAPPPPRERRLASPAAQRRVEALEARLEEHLARELDLIPYKPVKESL